MSPARADSENLPLFPLENVVLLPHLRVPLVIFEPRYRQMTRDALAGSRRIGMVVVRPDHVHEMGGAPPIFPIGCEGEIEQSKQLEDGRYNIVLLGLRRFRVLEEPSRPDGQLYRWARVDPLADANPAEDAERTGQLRRQISEQVVELARRTTGDANAALNPKLADETDDAMFANLLSQSLNFTAIEKQSLLEANSIRERAERLADLLDFRLLSLDAGAPSGSDTLH